MTVALLALFGAVVGAYGTIVGAGGGFLIVPALILSGLATPGQAAGTALVAVLATAASGTVAAARHARIDARTSVYLSMAAAPGALAGAHVSLSGPIFEVVFGALLTAVGAWLVVRPPASARAQATQPTTEHKTEPRRRGEARRDLVDAHGQRFTYAFSMPVAALLSAAVGFLSSALGIGGGVLMVPLFIQALGIPALIATATAQAVQVSTSALGAASHLALGHVLAGPAIALAAGAVIGAQVGAHLATRMKGTTIVRLLAGALVITGARLALRGFGVG